MLNDKHYALSVMTITILFLLAGLCFYIPNMAGNGLALPVNNICWMVMFCVAIIGFAARGQVIRYDRTLLYFIAGILLMLLPLLWQHSQCLQAAVPKMLMLSGGLLFYLSLLQIKLTAKQKQILIYAIVLSALIQSGLALWQTGVTSVSNWMEFNPGTRPYGIFQQTNVLASFVATGAACTLYLHFTAKRLMPLMLLVVILCFFTTVLLVLQSRAGYLGVLLYIFFAVTCFDNKRFLRTALVITAITGTAMTFYWLKQWYPDHGLLSSMGTVSKTASNYERIAILEATLKMISLRPLAGWGYGSFEHVAALTSLQYFHHFFTQNVTHPHNEVLYEWAEGGIMAPLGMLLLLTGYCLPLIKSSPVNRLAGGICIPILVHTMVEYPLIQSSTHWMLLLLLCRLSRREENIHESACAPGARYLLRGIAVAGLLFILTGLKTGSALTHFERSGMTDFTQAQQLINPWAQWSRFEYDQNVSLLMKFKSTQDESLLRQYQHWALCYLQQHNDAHVYNNLKVVASVLNDNKLLQQLSSPEYILYMVPK